MHDHNKITGEIDKNGDLQLRIYYHRGYEILIKKIHTSIVLLPCSTKPEMIAEFILQEKSKDGSVWSVGLCHMHHGDMFYGLLFCYAILNE